MKFLFLFLLSFNCLADNWVSKVDILSGFTNAYESKEFCEKQSAGVVCFNIGDYPAHVYDQSGSYFTVNEQKLSEYQAKLASDQAISMKQNLLNSALKDMDFGRKIIAMVRLSSVAKGLTDEQTDLIESNMAPIIKKLELGKIPQAKVLIEAINPDGVLITSTDKSAVLAEISAYLGQ